MSRIRTRLREEENEDQEQDLDYDMNDPSISPPCEGRSRGVGRFSNLRLTPPFTKGRMIKSTSKITITITRLEIEIQAAEKEKKNTDQTIHGEKCLIHSAQIIGCDKGMFIKQ